MAGEPSGSPQPSTIEVLGSLPAIAKRRSRGSAAYAVAASAFSTAAARVGAGRVVGLGKFTWLIVDQGVFALTNLALNVMFARWLMPAEYGLFSLSFSGFILLSVVHWFIVMEPLLVHSAQIAENQTRSYVLVLIQAHGWFLLTAALISGISYCIAMSLGAHDLALCIVATGLGGSAVLLLLVARRLCLVFVSAAASARVGLMYLVAALSSGWLLDEAGLVTWLALWVVMGGWSIAGAGAIAIMVLRRTRGGGSYAVRDLLRSTAPRVRWGVFAAGFSWLRSDAVYVALAYWAGLPTVAQTRAIVTLSSPIVQINSALNAASLVDLGKPGRDQQRLREVVLRRIGAYAASAVMAVTLSWVLRDPITRIVYGERYAAGASELPLFCLAYALNGIETIITSAMKATGDLRHGYLPQVAGSLVVAMLAVTMIRGHGALWAAPSVLGGAAVGIIVATILFSRRSVCVAR
jgi:O-antigen/teichoic acid export membrane protein